VRLLAIDTAGPVAGVALFVDGAVRCRIERVTRGAEARLVPWAVELCEEAGTRLPELDAVAVAVGPGAFTGLRVGLATGLGLAAALDVPVWAGSSLTSRAARVQTELPVWAALDARKQRVYAERFEAGVSVAGPGDLDPTEALACNVGPFVAVGEGALVYRELVEAAGGTLAEQADHPAVDALARLGVEGLARGEGKAAADVRPVYLRDADAKRPRPR
jgi:tRNA threonylcarbamoyladenosine biosynthesis protein TsaB